MGHLTLQDLEIVDCGLFYEVIFYSYNIEFISRDFFDSLAISANPDTPQQ